jgi:cell division protein FtsQ
VPFPRSAAGGRPELARLLPSGRSLLTGLLILLTGLGLYAAARGTSAFAVREVAVEGTSPELARDVRAALAPVRSESLLELDLDDLARRAEALPMVAGVAFDRAFPHTLRVVVRPEIPVAVLRQGSASWLASAHGRVIAVLERGARAALPRIWLKRDVEVRLGETLAGPQRRAVGAVAPLADAPLPVAVASVVASRGELTLVLRNRVELRLGDATDLAVKLAVARVVLPQLAGSEDYLDVSVPERPVAGSTLDSQVEVETSTSTTP